MFNSIPKILYDSLKEIHKWLPRLFSACLLTSPIIKAIKTEATFEGEGWFCDRVSSV